MREEIKKFKAEEAKRLKEMQDEMTQKLKKLQEEMDKKLEEKDAIIANLKEKV